MKHRLAKLERFVGARPGECPRCHLPHPPADRKHFVSEVLTAALEDREAPFCRCSPWPEDPVADLGAAILAGDRSNPRTE